MRVTDDPTRAEAAIREVWGGGLCITSAAHTEAELRQVQRQLSDVPGFLSSGVDVDTVEVCVASDDGSIQAGLDEQYGAGLVRVSPPSSRSVTDRHVTQRLDRPTHSRPAPASG